MACGGVDKPLSTKYHKDKGMTARRNAGIEAEDRKRVRSMARTPDFDSGDIRSNRIPVTILALPLPPSINHAYLTTKTGKRIMTSECRGYRETTAMRIRYALKIKEPHKHLSFIQYRFFFPDNRKRDIPDNYSKVLRDCLKGTLVEDDCWQCITEERFIAGGIDKENPRVEITWEILA